MDFNQFTIPILALKNLENNYHLSLPGQLSQGQANLRHTGLGMIHQLGK